MSSPAALATVTATLQHLLTGIVPGATVTTQPPSTARNGGNGPQINIFLYGIYYNTAFTNTPLPGTARNGEHACPPLPLVLKYLITAYGLNDDDISGQQLMGQAMSLLHDHPLLGRADIEGITPDSNLHRQIERIRITPDALSLDDMSKLWSSFQSAEYRLSMGYEISVVLIESSRPSRTPLPVLKRGMHDRGPSVQAGLAAFTPDFPTLTHIKLPNEQASAMLGDTLTLSGYYLDGDKVTVRFAHPELPDPILVTVLDGGTTHQLSMQIPDNPADWLVGLYSVEVIINKAGEPDRITNVRPLLLGPRIITITPENPIARDGSGGATLILTASPQVRIDQRASLLLGDREVLAEKRANQSDSLTFIVKDAPVGSRHIRLRVDGIDSVLVNRSVTPPAFDGSMEVTIT